MIEFSIIIVTYNTKALTLNCLRSIFDNARSSFEVILVDNDSRDGTSEAVARFFPEIKLIVNHANFGFARAVNQGLRLVRGRKIVLLNSDTELNGRGTLEKMGCYLDRHPEIGLLGPSLMNPDGSSQAMFGRFPSIWTQFFQTFHLYKIFPWGRIVCPNIFTRRLFDTIHAVDWLAGAAIMLRREVLRQLGPLDEKFFLLFEDTDWCQRCWKLGYRVVYFPNVKMSHQHRASSQTSQDKARALIAERQSILYYYRKHSQSNKWRRAIFRWLVDLMIRLRAWRWQLAAPGKDTGWGSKELHRALLKTIK